MALKASGGRLPRVELEETGPRLDAALRRSKLASDDLYRLARKAPKVLKAQRKPRKNISEVGTPSWLLGRGRWDWVDVGGRVRVPARPRPRREAGAQAPPDAQSQGPQTRRGVFLTSDICCAFTCFFFSVSKGQTE